MSWSFKHEDMTEHVDSNDESYIIEYNWDKPMLKKVLSEYDVYLAGPGRVMVDRSEPWINTWFPKDSWTD